MIADTVVEYKAIRKVLKPLLEGVVLCIDPSCGSKGETGSLPGWAVSVGGKLMGSGVIHLPVEEDLWVRLQALHHGLRALVKEYDPDVMVYEQIAPRRYGGGSAHSHASLLKAVGVTLSVSGPSAYVGLRPTVWTRWKRSTYVKGDRADAVEMLYIALATAQEIEIQDPPRGYGKKATGKTSSKKPRKAAEVIYVPEEGEIVTGGSKQRQPSRRGRKARKKVQVPPF